MSHFLQFFDGTHGALQFLRHTPNALQFGGFARRPNVRFCQVGH
jgi:hypothetical protein